MSPAQALSHLEQILALPHHEFWTETVAPPDLAPLRSSLLVGHRQVTDAYLIGLAAHHGGKLATLDQSLSNLLPESDSHRESIETLPVV